MKSYPLNSDNGVLVLRKIYTVNKMLSVMLSILCITLSVTNSYKAHSAEIDGMHDVIEWDSAVITMLVDGESNSGVDFGMVQTMIDSENSAVFFCFMHKDPSLVIGNTVTGVMLSVENSDYFEVTPASSPAFADSSEYSFEGFTSTNDDNGATTEIRVGFKLGIPREISGKVRFIDAEGKLSNVYSFTVINDEYTETTELLITQAAPETTKKSSAKSAATTKKKTATTKKKSETKKATADRSEEETEEFEISKTPRRYTYVRTTKLRATEKAETSAKAKKTSPATVYYHEKEVIISQVYVTLTEELKTGGNITDTEETTAAAQTQNEASSESATEAKSTFSLSEGTKKKALIGIMAAVSFTVIAVAGTKSSKKKSDNDENPDSQ